MGLGSVQASNATYLSIAGGYIWDRKKGESDPNFAKQSFIRADKTEGVRQGAQYANLTGKVVGVQFRTHDEYGDSINVTVDTKEGDRYIVSISLNNRYSQDMMKALLKIDLTQDLFLKPYDFVGKDKKRAQGISFRQNGEKIDLRIDTPKEHQKEKDWFKTASKKHIKRFFEDLSDWFRAEVEERVIPQLSDELPPLDNEPKPSLGAAPKEDDSKPADEVESDLQPVASVTPVKMRKAIKEYMAENYPKQTLPKLDKDQLVIWYNLVLEGEELPLISGEGPDADVSDDDLDEQLDNLMG